MQTQFHIIYKTIDKNGKYYVGRHSTYNLDDGYLGSGKWVKSIKDTSSLTREILSYHNSFEELLEAEEKILSNILGLPGNMNFSDKPNGFGTGMYNPSHGGTGRSWNKGKKCPEISEGRKNGKKPKLSSEKRSEITKANWNLGLYNNRPNPSPEHKEKISKALTGRTQTDHQKQRMKEVHTGKTYGVETREKIRQASIIRENEIKTCPYCGCIGSGPVMKRWHFSNCKLSV